ncbi:MAG: hypothetical protein HN353_12250 [Bdellovibrionales bacterium]|jgi:hypothetical protein|nr:hypothetical protein [Bdellovibrionales bacterium]MBT3526132.1 hypothetical protein [Bdellovibrionales bacterium]MBT7668729.1 hypothetical protein [Bdellovibrionales bacterium]MBT7766873.1 hypothetical protein [Bdellovibrionales bacterium]
MIKFPAQRLPDYFTLLLRGDVPTINNGWERLDSLAYNTNSAFYAIVSKFFCQIDPQVRVKEIVKILGWHRFRNQLATLFIHYQQYGSYPDQLEMDLSSDLTIFEEKIRDYTLPDNSRAFLLAFYLSMSSLSLQDGNEGNTHLIIPERTLALLSHFNRRIERVDWVIILLIHFNEFLGEENILRLLQDGASYQEIYQMLANREKRILLGNLLSYGFSINESDVFINDVI